MENKDGLSVARAYGLDSFVEIPEADLGTKITGVSPYCFSETQRGIETPKLLYGDEPVAGTLVEAVRLPSTLKRIGAYAFYNCFQLRYLSLYSTTTDLGAGLFTGCTALSDIDIYVDEQARSCFQELLMELSQTLRVNYYAADGTLLAKLIFPVFFENSIENTPGRILMRDMHGCGMMYRNCFQGTSFSFAAYDKLFSEVDLYEGAGLACELAIKRLMHPYQLCAVAREEYAAYLLAHAAQAAKDFDAQELRSFLSLEGLSSAQLDEMLELIIARGDQSLTALLMQARYALASQA